MFRPPTRHQTLYRLPVVIPTPAGMFDALTKLSGELLDGMGADVQPVVIAGSPALWLDGQFEHPIASWCGHAEATTGLRVSHANIQSAGLLMLAVDGVVYALGYGSGHRLIPDELKDPGFGLRFAVRRLDPEQVQDLVRRFPGARGRHRRHRHPWRAPDLGTRRPGARGDHPPTWRQAPRSEDHFLRCR